MRVLVTGAAGFIGSRLARALVDQGADVTGCDAMTDYYSISQKRFNLHSLSGSSRFDFAQTSLEEFCATNDLSEFEVVFHQAGQPGVRGSWANGLNDYVAQNISATNALVSACAATSGRKPRIVYASSSSIYGNADTYPVNELAVPTPFSPYGMTKLAGEHLCCAYAYNFGMQVVALRYFTVFGPGQRPDMAIHRLIKSSLVGDAFPMFGDGSQVRDFTYVDDVVAANLAAATCDVTGPLIVNVCGGAQTSLGDLIDIVERGTGSTPILDRRPAQLGDVRRTGGDNSKARQAFGWDPQVSIDDGVVEQIEWMRSYLSATRS